MKQKKRPSSIISIDPGNKHSAYTIIDTETYRPLLFGKHENDEIRTILADHIDQGRNQTVVIETMMSMGMRVGSEVFDTCIFIGRLSELAESLGGDVYYINRRQEKLAICGTVKANDKSIREALVERFANGEKNYGKGNKKEHGWFFGFKADVWSAYCVGVTFLDMQKREAENAQASCGD